MEKLNSDVSKEFLIVASYFEDDILKKIPDEFMQMLVESAADSNKDFYIDEDKSLVEQDISEECKDLIALIDYLYVLSNDEKEIILKQWIKNNK